MKGKEWRCSRCGRILRNGEAAFVGVLEGHPGGLFGRFERMERTLCGECAGGLHGWLEGESPAETGASAGRKENFKNQI